MGRKKWHYILFQRGLKTLPLKKDDADVIRKTTLRDVSFQTIG